MAEKTTILIDGEIIQMLKKNKEYPRQTYIKGVFIEKKFDVDLKRVEKISGLKAKV